MKKLTLILAIVLATTTVNAQHMEHSINKSTNSKEMTRFIKSQKYLELNQSCENCDLTTFTGLWQQWMHYLMNQNSFP